MGITSLKRAPFPYFGGKGDAAAPVWEALGDVNHYIEPFAGSLAVLLRRPHAPNRPNYDETVNDLDGLIVNAWRGIKLSPKETAEAASWPVTEIDLKARSIALVKWRESKKILRLAGDPDWYDPKMAGWWIWCSCASIVGFGGASGPWWVDSKGNFRKLKKKPGNKGIDGRRPSLDTAQGILNASMKGVDGSRPCIASNRGVLSSSIREPAQENTMVMSDLLVWFNYLSNRLRHTRILNGNWIRVCKKGAAETLVVREGKGVVGFFLDPPYGDVGRATNLYGKTESLSVAEKVQQWCIENGNNEKYRIVYAGFDVEGKDLEEAGWRVIEWFKPGGLKGGMGNTKKDKKEGEAGHQQHRERLWLSPHCLKPKKKARKGLFEQ